MISDALSIINRLLPTQDRRDVITLDDLVVCLAILTKSKKRSKYKDMAIIRKQMKRIRQEVRYEKSA